MNAPWDTQQREWLQAMGYEVMVPAGAPAAADVNAHVATGARVPADVPLAAMREAPDATAVPGSPAWPDGPLLRALLRAARARDPQALAALLPSPDALRGDAGAKRALWPRLRALRRTRRH